MSRVLTSIALLALLALPASARDLPRGVAGVTVGMSENKAHAVLEKIGVRTEEAGEEEQEGAPGTEREMWTLRDPRYAYLQLLVGPDGRVSLVQGWLRQGGPGMRFGDIGDVSEAKKLGLWIYRWTVPGKGKDPGRQIMARGADSLAVGSIMISSLAPADARERR